MRSVIEVPINEATPGPPECRSDAAAWHTRTEMFDFDDKMIIKTALADVERDDIDLRLEDRDLVIYRARHHAGDAGAERPLGAMLRRIPMPFLVPARDIRATFDNGVLRMEVRRPAGGRPRSEKIAVR
jgi:HSP20 family protein